MHGLFQKGWQDAVISTLICKLYGSMRPWPPVLEFQISGNGRFHCSFRLDPQVAVIRRRSRLNSVQVGRRRNWPKSVAAAEMRFSRRRRIFFGASEF